MREILFRGKEVKSGEWTYGSLIQNNDKVFIASKQHNSSLEYCFDCNRPCEDIDEVTTDTVGQFTGLIDMKGVMIFEGDILEAEIKNNKYISKVEHATVFFNKDELKFDTDNQVILLKDWIHKVVGNIHTRVIGE